MKAVAIACVLLLTACIAHADSFNASQCGGWYTPERPLPKIISKYKGMTLFSDEDNPDYLSSENAIQRLEEMKKIGATAVSAQIPFVQQYLNDSSMVVGFTMDSLQYFLQHAASLRITVLVHPIVLVTNDPTGFQWLCLNPSNPSEWFSNMQTHLTSLVQLMSENNQTNGLLTIGLENWSMYGSQSKEITFLENLFCKSVVNNSAFNYGQAWSNMATDLKQEVISLKSNVQIGYAADSSTFKLVPFWSSLDFIGLDAYPPLQKEDAPTMTNIYNNWIRFFNSTFLWRTQNNLENLPIIFTETGISSFTNATSNPAVLPTTHTCVDPFPCNFTEQAVAYEALIRAWSVQSSDFQGSFMYWYDTSHTPDFFSVQKQGRIWQCGFTPRGKPAWEILLKAFSL